VVKRDQQASVPDRNVTWHATNPQLAAVRSTAGLHQAGGAQHREFTSPARTDHINSARTVSHIFGRSPQTLEVDHCANWSYIMRPSRDHAYRTNASPRAQTEAA